MVSLWLWVVPGLTILPHSHARVYPVVSATTFKQAVYVPLASETGHCVSLLDRLRSCDCPPIGQMPSLPPPFFTPLSLTSQEGRSLGFPQLRVSAPGPEHMIPASQDLSRVRCLSPPAACGGCPLWEARNSPGRRGKQRASLSPSPIRV